MSRIGRKSIPIPSGVTIEMSGEMTKIKGPLGTLEQSVPKPFLAEVEGNTLHIRAQSDAAEHRAMHGLIRSLVANAVHGVSQGFEKKLEIVGVGYNAKAEGKTLTLRIGFCHPVVLKIPEGLEITTPEPTQIIVKGCDKQLTGEMAAEIRAIRPPEPYKGKGIRYADEHVRRKAGKTFVAAG